MAPERLNEIDALIKTTNLVHGLSREERRMLHALIELRDAYVQRVDDTDAAYKKGYSDGQHDEADRQYNERKKVKAEMAAAAKRAAEEAEKEATPEEAADVQ